MSDTCSVKVDRSGSSRWSNFQACGRPAVEDGLCKLHLRVRDRRRAKNEAFRESMNRGERLLAEAEELGYWLGVDVQAEFSWTSREYTGDFIVPGDWLREIAAARKAAS